MKKSVIAVVLAVSVAAVATWVVLGFFSGGRPVEESTPSPADKQDALIKSVAAEKPRGTDAVGNVDEKKESPRRGRSNGADKKAMRIRVKAEDLYTPEERKLADNLQDASDENSLAGVRKAVSAIMGQKNAELKVEAINALGFYGKDSLQDLMEFLKDPSQEVVDAATDRIALSLEELGAEDNAFRAEFIYTLLSVDGLCGKDAVVRFIGQLETMGSGDEKEAVQTLVSLINGDNIGDVVKTKAKEGYQFVTGEEYTTLEAAEKWYNDKLTEEEQEKQEESDDDDEPEESADENEDSDEDPDEDPDEDSENDGEDEAETTEG